MPVSLSKKLPVLLLTVAYMVGMLLVTPISVYAQDSEQCTPPDFQITSSKDITALVGESFTYFVVAQGSTNYRLTTKLPSGLSYASSRISGTPQQTGNFPLQFTATNECGSTTQTVMLSVVNADKLAQAQGSTQKKKNQQNVQLNEIPDTGMSADKVLTLTFYMLALLSISVAAARSLYRQPATNSNTYTKSQARNSDRLSHADMRRRRNIDRNGRNS